ncbi:MAG: hypothetical protein AB8B66_04210 [Rickettsiaceae bacterium]
MVSQRIFLLFLINIIVNSHASAFEVPLNRVMTIEEFKQALDNNKFLQREKYTTKHENLDNYEIELINLAHSNQNVNFGGIFDNGREINNFNGSTLLVGGGKTSGPNGENDGKTILINHNQEIKEMQLIIDNLVEGALNYNPYTGAHFQTNQDKINYIERLKQKINIYQSASKLINDDILAQYYTLNIEDKIYPDILASITSENDMSKIPNSKFERVEFENVPCDVFLNPKLYGILSRITKVQGTISFSISYSCRRLIVPVIEKTKYGNEFKKILKSTVYTDIKNMDKHYGSYSINLQNF